MSKAEELADKISALAQGRQEWHVRDPLTKAYCLAAGRRDEAQGWQEDFKQRFPDHRFCGYEIAQVDVRTELELQSLEAAAHLRALDASHQRLKEALEAIKAKAGRPDLVYLIAKLALEQAKDLS